jgi:hypothetical protein
MRKVRRMLQPIKYGESFMQGYLYWPRDFLLLQRVPYQLPCRWLIVKEVFTLCFRDWILIALAYNSGFKITPWVGERASLGTFKK